MDWELPSKEDQIEYLQEEGLESSVAA